MYTGTKPNNYNQFSSVQFSPLIVWVVGGTRGTIQQRFSSSLSCRRPLRAVLASWTGPGMSTLGYCPPRISSADHAVTHPPNCPEGWFWRGCCGVWYARTMPVSVSWHLPEEVPVAPQGYWSCSAPSHLSCAPSRRCGEVSSGTWFRKPGSFSQSQQAGSVFHSYKLDVKNVQLSSVIREP